VPLNNNLLIKFLTLEVSRIIGFFNGMRYNKSNLPVLTCVFIKRQQDAKQHTWWTKKFVIFLSLSQRPFCMEIQSRFIFTVRRYALHGLCDRNSVCLSVCLSVTLVHCVHMVRPTIMISSPYGRPIVLVSGDITFTPKFEGGHPERGR